MSFKNVTSSSRLRLCVPLLQICGCLFNLFVKIHLSNSFAHDLLQLLLEVPGAGVRGGGRVHLRVQSAGVHLELGHLALVRLAVLV